MWRVIIPFQPSDTRAQPELSNLRCPLPGAAEWDAGCAISALGPRVPSAVDPVGSGVGHTQIPSLGVLHQPSVEPDMTWVFSESLTPYLPR